MTAGKRARRLRELVRIVSVAALLNKIRRLYSLRRQLLAEVDFSHLIREAPCLLCTVHSVIL